MSEENYNHVRKIIEAKQSDVPYHASVNSKDFVTTEYNIHPYNKWWKGKHTSEDPIIAEREAGWRPYTSAQLHKQNILDTTPNHCFDKPCSTISPCIPK
jgi:hypothetical protein